MLKLNNILDKWVPINSTSKVDCCWIRDLIFEFCLYQKSIGILKFLVWGANWLWRAIIRKYSFWIICNYALWSGHEVFQNPPRVTTLPFVGSIVIFFVQAFYMCLRLNFRLFIRNYTRIQFYHFWLPKWFFTQVKIHDIISLEIIMIFQKIKQLTHSI